MKKKTKKKVAKKVAPMRSFVFTGNQDNPGKDPVYVGKYNFKFQKNGKPVGVTDTVAVKLSDNPLFTEQ